MTESKTKKTEYTMDFEKEKLELVKLRIRNKFYDRSDVLEKVVMSIIQNQELSQKSDS
jgi:hypothetical protein